MRNAAPGFIEILYPQLAELIAPQRMEQQRRQDGTIALLLDGFLAGRGQQVASVSTPNSTDIEFDRYPAMSTVRC